MSDYRGVGLRRFHCIRIYKRSVKSAPPAQLSVHPLHPSGAGAAHVHSDIEFEKCGKHNCLGLATPNPVDCVKEQFDKISKSLLAMSSYIAIICCAYYGLFH